MSDQNRIALETQIDKDGREFSTTRTSTPGGVDEMFISPNQAIPVVFVPGIMGSPLIATGDNRGKWDGQGKWAWFPDDAYSWVVKGYGKLEHDQRRHLLDPTKTRALDSARDADMAQLESACKGTSMPAEEAARRGWGSVMISCYGKILLHLENQLRFIFYRGHPYPGTYGAMPSNPAAWGDLKGYDKLSDETLRKAAAWRFPVYAVGYNWVDSNSKAADFLKERIDAIRADCRNRLKLKCDKVILVTHSMGGLVARMCAKRNPDDILGIVHGEQPAIGAGTAYARVRGGWDYDWTSFISYVGAKALGKTAWEVSAVFSAGAGPLELLPNHLYGSGWLKIQYGKGRSAETVVTLPKKDPYEEIYKDKAHWWRLIHPECLVEKKKITDAILKGKEWDKYIKQLSKAQAFHADLGAYYHPKTYAHCGADSGQPAWHEVAWQLDPMAMLDPLSDPDAKVRSMKPSPAGALEASFVVDYMDGRCEIHDKSAAGDVWINRNGVGVIAHSNGNHYRAYLSDKDDAGDATVPAHSGLAPRDHATFFAKMKGFEHQGSYENETVQAVTLYSMISLAATAEKLA